MTRFRNSGLIRRMGRKAKNASRRAYKMKKKNKFLIILLVLLGIGIWKKDKIAPMFKKMFHKGEEA